MVQAKQQQKHREKSHSVKSTFLCINNRLPGAPGLASFPLIVFLHLFRKRTFLEVTRGFYKLSVLPVTQSTMSKH